MQYAVQESDVQNDNALAACYGIFRHLRPHLDEAQFNAQVRVQAAEGYRIVYIAAAGTVVAAAGFRIANFLAWGWVLYIDDLNTHPERKRAGLCGALLDWLIAEGKRVGCNQVHMDSGHQLHDAHRFYLNRGFILGSHHMSLRLG